MDTDTFNVAAFQRHLGQSKLMASRCAGCGALYLPPRPICSACHAQSMTWQELQGNGTVVGFTSIAIVPASMAARGYGRDRPYLTGIVALREGPSVAARIEVGDTTSVEQGVHVGMPVSADFVEEADGEETIMTLVFRPG